jgi:hypothetical protein
MTTFPPEPAAVVPSIVAQQPADGNVVMAGMLRMIVPTIMQTSCGGYLTVIPGVGVLASTTVDEAMDFINRSAQKHFQGKGEFPKVVAATWAKTKESIKGAAGRMDSVVLAMAAAGMLVGWTFLGGQDHDNKRPQVGTYNISATRPAQGSSLLRDSGGGEAPRPERPLVLPEVYVRTVRTTPYDGDAQYPLENGYLRPMRPHD